MTSKTKGKAIRVVEQVAFIAALLLGLLALFLHLSNPGDTGIRGIIQAAGYTSLGFVVMYHVSRFMGLKYPA